MGVEGIIFEPHPPNFEIYTTFKDVQMILKSFFDISTGFRFWKISVECSVHSCSCPWLDGSTHSDGWLEMEFFCEITVAQCFL
jgi:hypothetical protein